MYAAAAAKTKEIDDYINNGGYDKYKAGLKQGRIDEVRIAKSIQSNSTGKSLATKYYARKGGQLKRFSIPVKNWKVEYNYLGNPINKYLSTQVGYEKDGACWRAKGILEKQYLGGGKYGSIVYKHIAIKEMNCDNVHK